MSTTRWPVSVKKHARHRMQERCPDVKPARAVDEVRAAVDAGRLSVERPDWLLRRHQLHPHAEKSLYAWTADRERVYILHTTANEFVVMSVLTRERT